MESSEGNRMHELATRLFPICRSITGDGVRKTLDILKESIPLVVHEVPSGTQVFDWTVPKEWNIRSAWIRDSRGNTVVDFANNNLHVVGYSVPVDREISLAELQEHLYSIPEQPGAIPYVTSYYKERWGFCMTHHAREALVDDTYHVRIDSTLAPGSLTYGELILPGKSKKEILLSTYVCHPSMANNELSGPVLAVELARWIMSAPRKYTYRIVFIPEIIGSLVYLHEHLTHMREHIVAGFILTCVGDERGYSFMPSRTGDTLADRVALRSLRAHAPTFKTWSYFDRGSDERNYCSPSADLPVVSMMRSRYDTYPEYHTSLDNLSVVTPTGLQGSLDLHKECLETLERESLYKAVYIGEPQLGRRGLYPLLSKQGSVGMDAQQLLNLLAYADGTRLPEDIADLLHVSVAEILPSIAILKDGGLIVDVAIDVSI